MKRVQVSELRADLSGYLAQVRNGRSIVVCDRNMPIAHLVPTASADDLVVREPTRPLVELRRLKGIRPKGRVDVERLLPEDRER